MLNNLIIFSIGIIYTTFCFLLINQIIDEDYKDKCSWKNRKDNKELQKKCETIKLDNKLVDFRYTTILGFIGLLTGFILNNSSGHGLILGSVLLFVLKLIIRWNDILNKQKLLVTTIILILLLYYSSKFI